MIGKVYGRVMFLSVCLLISICSLQWKFSVFVICAAHLFGMWHKKTRQADDVGLLSVYMCVCIFVCVLWCIPSFDFIADIQGYACA